MTAHDARPNDLSSSSLFRTVIETAVDGIVVIEASGKIQLCNPAIERMFGYRAAEIVGENVGLLMPSPYRDEHDSYLANFIRTGEKKIIGIGREVSGRRKDSTIFPMYLSVGEGRLAEEEVFVGIIRDLTDLKSETALREDANRHLAQIVKSSDDAILSRTLDGVITSWNSSAQRIFGYSEEEVLGKNISILMPAERLSEEDVIVTQLKAGRDIEHFETARRHKDGREILVSLSVSPIRDGRGNIVGASKILRDITDKKQSEARLLLLQTELAHVARLSAMGHMTAAIAHELNQPLTAIANYVNAARRTLIPAAVAQPDDVLTRAQDLMEKAAAQTLRAGGIIRNLREFVEKREIERAAADMNVVVREAVALGLVGVSDSDMKVRLNLAASLPTVLINRIQIQQVLLNLIRNSLEAMFDSMIRELTLTTAHDGSEFVQIAVADTGPGLPAEVAARLFQPFTTTKEKGMGIGLTICQSIVDSHGGRMWVSQDVPQGTTFCIRLPVSNHPEAAP